MRHYYFKLFFAALLCIATTRAQAHDFVVDGIYYNITNKTNQTVEVTFRGNYPSDYNEYHGDIVIPRDVYYQGKTYDVIGIGEHAFQDNLIKSIIIPNSVTIIGFAAFLDCTGLTSITIPNSVNIIESSVFKRCSSLKRLYIEDGETVLSIEGDSQYWKQFDDCDLKYIYIGRDIKYSGYSLFSSQDFDTIHISKKQTSKLDFSNRSKHFDLHYIDNDYSEVIPHNLTESTTLHYFNMPYRLEEIQPQYKDITNYFIKELNCKAKMIPLGDIQIGFESITVDLNDTLAIECGIKNNGEIYDRTVNLDNIYLYKGNDGVYRATSLGINTEHILVLNYFYNNNKHTTKDTIYTKSLKPESSVSTTLSTATIRFNEGDTLGISKSIDKIGVFFNDEYYPTTTKDELHDLPYCVELKNISPDYSGSYCIYYIIGTDTVYSALNSFTTKKPTINVYNSSSTQTTLNLKIRGTFCDSNLSPKEVGVQINGKNYIADKDSNVLVTKLSPSSKYSVTPYVKYEKYGCYTGQIREFTTARTDLRCTATTTATTISLEGTHDVGDATIVEYGFVDWETNTGCILLTGLEPDTEYSFTYYVTTEEGGTVQTLVTVRTEQLVFNTLKAKATSNTRAVICAETNISEEESGTGFEWRRIDAPDLVPSEFAPCAVHEGVMEGALHNLSANTYYKYRPCYTSQSGKSYYGEWIGFGTADAYVYFTPTVHTYATASAGTNAARLSGYVLAGSDDIIEQGFEYWPVGKAETAVMHSTHNNGNVKRVTATGQRMSIVVEELDYGTVYMCRAYARTAKETVYGEEQSFETSYPNSIEENREESITIQTSGNTVYINGCNENDTVFVYTLFGAVAYNGPEKEITLNSGTYIVKAGNITKKIQIR